MDLLKRVHESDRLVELAKISRVIGLGFGWLDDSGQIDPAPGVQTWITTRMTHVFALETMRGDPSAAAFAASGVASLSSGPLRDAVHGGWFGSVDSSGVPLADHKLAYDHAFVLLAASSAVRAGISGSRDLYRDALEIFHGRFLDEVGRVIDGYRRDFSEPEPYRGANSSMHSVEALLAVADLTQQESDFAVVQPIIDHLMGEVTGEFENRLPEHFDATWEPLPEYNRDHKQDQFRPYGVTPGHLLEWSRLLLLAESGFSNPPDWLLSKSQALFAAAVEIGWSVDGADGFVYTTDWKDHPVVRSRMHWVHAEAVAAAAVLAARTGQQQYRDWSERWWDFIETNFMQSSGNWIHELGPDNCPASEVWSGRPDIYHAYQALLLEDLPVRPSVAGSLSASIPD